MRTDEHNAVPVPAIGYSVAWLRRFLMRASGLDFADGQVVQIAALAERKLADLFEVAEATAIANGRTHILRHDLPITKGLRRQVEDVALLARDVEAGPVLAFLARAGVPGPLDELVQAEMPRLTAALLLLGGRVIALVGPENIPALERVERLERILRPAANRPTRWEIERANSVLDLTL